MVCRSLFSRPCMTCPVSRRLQDLPTFLFLPLLQAHRFPAIPITRMLFPQPSGPFSPRSPHGLLRHYLAFLFKYLLLKSLFSFTCQPFHCFIFLHRPTWDCIYLFCVFLLLECSRQGRVCLFHHCLLEPALWRSSMPFVKGYLPWEEGNFTQMPGFCPGSMCLLYQKYFFRQVVIMKSMV